MHFKMGRVKEHVENNIWKIFLKCSSHLVCVFFFRNLFPFISTTITPTFMIDASPILIKGDY